MDILAAQTYGGRIISATVALRDPQAHFRCCGCGARMSVSPNDHFIHSGADDCGSPKWMHDWAVASIGQKKRDKKFALPGGMARLDTTPKMEAEIVDRRMSKDRRVDVGLRCSAVDSGFGSRRYGPVSRLAVEVTNTSGKDAAYVADMKAIGMAVVEFDLKAFLRSGKANGDLLKSISTWANNSGKHKHWLNVTPPFQHLYDHWEDSRIRRGAVYVAPLDGYTAKPIKLNNVVLPDGRRGPDAWGMQIAPRPPRERLLHGAEVVVNTRSGCTFTKRIGEVVDYNELTAICSEMGQPLMKAWV